MKIHIITMEDPLYSIGFIEDIVKVRHKDITGITIAKGGRLKIGKKKSKIRYVCTLFLIMGPVFFSQNVFRTLFFKIKKKVSLIFPVFKEPGLKAVADKYNIPVGYTNNPNSEEYLNQLREIEPDVIINQSQFIIKKELINIPDIGVLNRHNALLPKNRGRLTPFWVLYNEEVETGVSIHFVEEGIDSGPIIVQKKITLSDKDTFKSVVEKNYELASNAMLEAIDLLEKGFQDYISNNDDKATYNTIPTFKEAINFRKKRIIQKINSL